MVRAAAERVGTGARGQPHPVGSAAEPGHLALACRKHEAAGNDFLVVLDPDSRIPVTGAWALALCDRTRGVGADGLVVGRRGTGGTALEMELFNADGSVAELSGNGVGCLVQAAVALGMASPGPVRVRTGAGVRTVEYEPGRQEGSGTARVDMGTVRLGPELASPLPGTRARRADVGNPHVVVVGDVDLAALDLLAVASAAEEAAGGTLNVEVVRARARPGTLTLRVHERGVGETAACGTGSCAAAAVARSFGLAGDRVVVENPGGDLVVTLGAREQDPVVLTTEVRHVADLVVDAGVLRDAGITLST